MSTLEILKVQAENLVERESVDDLLHLIQSISETPNLGQDSIG